MDLPEIAHIILNRDQFILLHKLYNKVTYKLNQS